MAALAGSWALARLIYGAVIGKIYGRLDSLMDTLERRVHESVAAPR